MRWLLALLTLIGLGLAAQAQVNAPTYISAAYAFLNITTDTTTLVFSGQGILGAVCINSGASGETITIYNSLTGSGTKVGTITLATTSGGCFNYNAFLSTGLTVVTAVAAADLTIVWRPAP